MQRHIRIKQGQATLQSARVLQDLAHRSPPRRMLPMSQERVREGGGGGELRRIVVRVEEVEGA
jgi:hypothetical protein